MTQLQEPLTPEHDKFRPHQKDANTIGDFLEWLSEQGFRRMRWEEYEEDWIPQKREGWVQDRRNIQQLIAEFFGIDKKKFDEETEAIYQFVSAMANSNA